jgi:hypothetical protein
MAAPSSARKQAQLGVLVPHGHEVGQQRVAGDVVDMADDCALGGSTSTGRTRRRTNCAVRWSISRAALRRRPSWWKGGQLADDGVEGWYIEKCAEEPEHDRVVAGRVPSSTRSA